MARSAAEELVAYATLGQNICALVRASGLGKAKPGRKPGKQTVKKAVTKTKEKAAAKEKPAKPAPAPAPAEIEEE